MFTLTRRAFTVASMVACLGTAPLWARPAEPPRFDATKDMQDLPARWRPLMDEFLVPGMAVSVVKDGRLYAAEGFGSRDGDPGHTVNADTMFYIASITKTYNAFAVSMLADQGKLSLDDTIKQHLPRFTLADAAATRSLTIRDLLCHRPGIHSEPIVTLDAYTGEITDDRYYHWLAKATPRGEMQYSNIHFTVLGRVIESAGGLPWRDYLEKHLFTPAGMTRTTGYAGRMYADPNSATPMENLPDGTWRKAGQIKTDEVMHAAGGLGTTAVDGARWIMLNVNDGQLEAKPDGKRLLSKDRAKEMRSLQATHAKARGSLRVMHGYGLGWEVGTYAGTPLCSHGGGYIGTSAYVAILPEKKAGFFILMNASGPARGLSDVMAIDLLNRLTGENLAPDLLDNYKLRLEQEKAARAKEPAKPDLPLPKDFLSAPLAAYAGDYTSKELGTLHVTTGPQGLRLALGQCDLTVAPAEKDAFTVKGPIIESSTGVFEPGPGGTVRRVKLTHADSGAVVFERQ